MRVIALVSLALALAASSMPLTTRADGGVSAPKGESTGTLGAVGSGTSSATGFGPSYASGSKNLGPGYESGIGTLGTPPGGVGGLQSGSGTVTGSSGSINTTRRSTTSSTPGIVECALPQLGGEVASAVGSTTSISNPIPGDVNSDVSSLDGEVAPALGGTPSAPILPNTPGNSGALTIVGNSVCAGATDTLRLRAVTGSAFGAGQAVGGLGEIAAEQAGGAGNGAQGTVKGAGAAGSLSKSG